MPKSKKPWKAGSQRSGKHKRYNPKTWEDKLVDRNKTKALRDRVRETKEKEK